MSRFEFENFKMRHPGFLYLCNSFKSEHYWCSLFIF